MKSARTVLFFARTLNELEGGFLKAGAAVAEGGALWVIWPKKTSALRTDIGELEIRAFGLASGWVDYKVCAVDATWSGLAFARRD